MTALQPAVLVVLYKMMVRVARKRQWVQPKRINWCRSQVRNPRQGCCQMGQIMAKNVVPDNMIEAFAKFVQS